MKILISLMIAIILGINSYANVKWVSPSYFNCITNGGKINNENVCEAKWEDAKKICHKSEAFLPSIKAFRETIKECGGGIDSSDNAPFEFFEKNIENLTYQDCYMKKGFVGDFYWSSTLDRKYVNFKHAWFINFLNGFDNRNDIRKSANIRCIKIKK